MESKEEYRQKLEKQLNEWVKELDKLGSKAEEAGTEAMKKLPEKMAILDKKIEEGRAKLKELGEMNEDSLESLREGFDASWKSLKKGFKEAAEQFKWEKEKK
ncbi:MAG: coiled coil domain-containing protein [Bacillota bacterium]|nr:coiled coil domain-containing protein [Bacillota bacterium]